MKTEEPYKEIEIPRYLPPRPEVAAKPIVESTTPGKTRPAKSRRIKSQTVTKGQFGTATVTVYKTGLPDREERLPPDSRFDGQPYWLKGDDSFSLDVVGESHYQEALEDASGGFTEDGVNLVVWPDLLLDGENRYDKNAVKVQIEGRTVGHLSRADAQAFRERLATEGREGSSFRCKANIRGGWDRGEYDRGAFGVRLDVLLYD